MNARERTAKALADLHGLSFYVYQYRGGEPEICFAGGGLRPATAEETALWRALSSVAPGVVTPAKGGE